MENCSAALEVIVRSSEAEAGSGALPIEKIPSFAVGLRSDRCSVTELAKQFRLSSIPVLGYLRDQYLWLDARTLRDDEIVMVGQTVQRIIEKILDKDNKLYIL
jgi:L-seryl-tRNA(Ser) seleniumtransferase